jgi:hypothetical protein
MIFFFESLVALIVAVLLGALISKATLKIHQRKSLTWIFLIIFVISWAGGTWIKPFGPSICDFYWLPFVLTGIVTALIIAISTHNQLPRNRHETLELLIRAERQKKLNQFTGTILTLVMGVVLLLLLTAILFQ